MSSRERTRDRARRLAREAVDGVIAELRSRRLQLGLSQSVVAAAAGISQPALSRIERRKVASPAASDIFAIAAVLGLDVRLNVYEGGEPIHDHAQVRLLPAFRQRIHALLGWLTEVPLPIAGDRRAWDAVAIAPDGWTAIEAISRFGAADATVRPIRQKQRDDPRVRRVLVVIADTKRNRAAVDAARALLVTEFPLRGRDALRDLRAGRTPPADGIILLRVLQMA
jgi:transcriptional regulator with XRE-family HTH domain